MKKIDYVTDAWVPDVSVKVKMKIGNEFREPVGEEAKYFLKFFSLLSMLLSTSLRNKAL